MSGNVGRAVPEPPADGPPVVARVRGGLGNQLFMYAMARRLAHANGSPLAIDGVTGFEGGNKYRRVYMLDRFPIRGRAATPAERREPLASLRRSIRKRLDAGRPLAERSYVVQGEASFDPAIHAMSIVRPTTFEGYWQSERWFDDIADAIRAELTPRPALEGRNRELAARIEGTRSVALHVRFFRDPAATAASRAVVDYYRRAIERVRDLAPDARFFLFSDRPADALALLPLAADEVTVVDANVGDAAAHLDLYLMSRCRLFVTANSTFSWWAAWLGETPDSTILTPSFTADSGFLDWGSPGLIPDRWTRIEG